MFQMQSMTQAAPVSKAAQWTGWVLSAIPVLMILMASLMKLVKAAAVVEAMARAGIPENLIVPVGVIELICIVIYLIPSTSILGAILMTGLLGGATMTGLRAGDPSFPMPIVMGVLAWAGLWLREPRLKLLIPLRRKEN
jgi:hypothetical protein